jgi:hypothetical protein
MLDEAMVLRDPIIVVEVLPAPVGISRAGTCN